MPTEIIAPNSYEDLLQYMREHHRQQISFAQYDRYCRLVHRRPLTVAQWFTIRAKVKIGKELTEAPIQGSHGIETVLVQRQRK